MDLGSIPPDRLRLLRGSLGPSFVNRQQERFYDSQAPEVLYSGAFRAGKSRIGCEKAYWLARKYPGIPVGIFRKFAVTLAPSTERTLLQDVIPPEEIFRANKSERWIELRNGSRITLFGLDPDPVTGLPSKVGSVELGWAFVDEAAEVTEADWTMVKGRLSWPGIPYHQVSGATNPAAPTHWLKRRFTPPSESRVFIHASTLDNPALPADYVLEQLSMPDGYLRKRYVFGEWTAAEGQIWFIPDEQVRVSPPPFRRVVAGIDWGFVHAFACEVVGMSGSGRLSVVDEVYERGEDARGDPACPAAPPGAMADRDVLRRPLRTRLHHRVPRRRSQRPGGDQRCPARDHGGLHGHLQRHDHRSLLFGSPLGDPRLHVAVGTPRDEGSAHRGRGRCL